MAPTGPIVVPAGNRRGTFAAGPQGKTSAAGTPDLAGEKSAGNGSNGTGLKGRSNGLPAGLHVGAPAGTIAAIERNGGASGGNGTGDVREMASLNSSGVKPGSSSGRRTATGVSDDKITDVDRQVFGDRRPFGTILNMPNLNSSTGSWVMHFAELGRDQKNGELMQPLPTETSDPGYPLELIRSNVHGAVTLYAIIHSDGRVGDIRVLSSPDDRLDSWATSALSRWKFLPALKDGKPVSLEAVVVIPFRVRKTF